MDVISDDEMLELYMYLLLIMYSYYVSISTLQSERRWWVRPIFTERKEKGAFANLFTYMKSNDHEMFYKHTRMLPEQYNRILMMVKRKLMKRSRRESLSPELRLAMTVKYLAHGGSFQNLSWEFRVGHSTVSKVIKEKCEAIWEILQPIYSNTPTKDDWLRISEGFSVLSVSIEEVI